LIELFHYYVLLIFYLNLLYAQCINFYLIYFLRRKQNSLPLALPSGPTARRAVGQLSYRGMIVSELYKIYSKSQLSIWRLDFRDMANVDMSEYSTELPTGMPMPMRVIFTPVSLSFLVR